MLRLRAGTWFLALGLAVLGLVSSGRADVPRVGDVAKDFELMTVAGVPVKLSNLTAKGPVVLVVLRGYPGYQCPLCTRQVADLVGQAKKFEAAGASVLMVYPGPAEELKAHAEEFLNGKTLPESFRLAIDPDYVFTERYGLRWKAKNETAYPSTFLIDKEGKIHAATISKEHGGRVSSKNVLEALSKLK